MNPTEAERGEVFPPRRDVARVCAWAESVALDGVTEPLAYAWVPERTVAVLGLAQKADRELRLDALRADGVPVVRRASGGGAVILAEGVLCWGVFAPPSMFAGRYDIHGAFRQLTVPVLEICRARGLDARLDGISDLAATHAGKAYKIAGCAQLRKREAVLVHGSLLVSADTCLFETYLAYPSQTPEYREGRSHVNFCRTMAELLAQPLREAEVAEELHAFVTRCGWRWTVPPPRLDARAGECYEAKYSRAGWNFHHERK